MARPGAVVLSITPIMGPVIRLDWTHDEVSLDRFEIMLKVDGASTWTSYELGPRSDYGAAGVFSRKVVSPPGARWLVRALGTSSEPSLSNPGVLYTGTGVVGAWLIPATGSGVDESKAVFLATEDGGVEFEMSHTAERLTAPSRERHMVEFYSDHGIAGTLSGNLVEITAIANVTAEEWRQRLQDVVKNQKTYKKLWLVTRDLYVDVAIDDDPSLRRSKARETLYGVQVPFVQVGTDLIRQARA